MEASTPHGPERYSDATRYLCTAARVDQNFRERVMDELLDEDLRAVAPSVGFDLGPVLAHCMAAHQQRRLRDIGLLLTGVTAALLAPLWTLLAGLAMAFGGMMVPARQRRPGILRTLGTMVAGAAVAILLMVFVETLDEPAPGLDEPPVPGWLVGIPWLALLVGVAAYLVLVRDSLVTRRTLVTELRRDRFRPDEGQLPTADPYEKLRLLDVEEAQWGNVTVYGGYSPFVGYGTPLAGWSFALPIRSDGAGTSTGGTAAAAAAAGGADGGGGAGGAVGGVGGGAGGVLAVDGREGTPTFEVVDLIDHVRSRLAAIGARPAGGADPGGESGEQSAAETGGAGGAGGAGADPGAGRDAGSPDRLEGAWLEDRIFVCGDGLTGDPRFLPNREKMPEYRLPDEEVLRIAAHPYGVVRHYLCAFVPSWGGEVVASTFLHFSTDGKLLYLECARTVLEPLRRDYHEVDRLTEDLSAGQLIRLLGAAAGRLLPTALAAPVHLVRDAAASLYREGRRARAREAAREDLGYNYGVQTGVRELGVDVDYHNYFQVLDAAKHLKVVERHVLAAILDFLDERGVSTAEFRSRQMTILNQGVIQTGGLSMVGNQAIGSGATASQRVGNTKKARD